MTEKKFIEWSGDMFVNGLGVAVYDAVYYLVLSLEDANGVVQKRENGSDCVVNIDRDDYLALPYNPYDGWVRYNAARELCE